MHQSLTKKDMHLPASITFTKIRSELASLIQLKNGIIPPIEIMPGYEMALYVTKN